jgi:hypothetical protein
MKVMLQGFKILLYYSILWLPRPHLTLRIKFLISSNQSWSYLGSNAKRFEVERYTPYNHLNLWCLSKKSFEIALCSNNLRAIALGRRSGYFSSFLSFPFSFSLYLGPLIFFWTRILCWEIWNLFLKQKNANRNGRLITWLIPQQERKKVRAEDALPIDSKRQAHDLCNTEGSNVFFKFHDWDASQIRHIIVSLSDYGQW